MYRFNFFTTHTAAGGFLIAIIVTSPKPGVLHRRAKSFDTSRRVLSRKYGLTASRVSFLADRNPAQRFLSSVVPLLGLPLSDVVSTPFLHSSTLYPHNILGA